MDLDFQFLMATPVYRPSRTTTIGPTLIIIPDIILTVLIWDGVVTMGINIATICIGVTIDPVIIKRTTTMAINKAIKGVATIKTMGTINAKVTMDTSGKDKLIARIGRQTGRTN